MKKPKYMDPQIWPLVRGMNALGYKTYMSCQGHKNAIDGLFHHEAWVSFDKKDLGVMLKIKKRGYVDVYVRHFGTSSVFYFLVIDKDYLRLNHKKSFSWAIRDILKGLKHED
jgi:hypothetical protein